MNPDTLKKIRKRMKAYNTKRDAQMLKLKNRGWTAFAIAKKYGLSAVRIRQILKKEMG